jgi:glycosyltransferase involved in cell wall biosynthesis
MEIAAESTTGPLLSVTVLNYNYGRYLPQCLNSILSQTMSDFELILINDCSTDDSREVIAPYLADRRIRLVDHEANQGYVSSLLEGCDLSRGKYMTVISADDYVLRPDAFDVTCTVMETHQAVAFCYSSWHEVDNSGAIRHTRRDSTRDYVRRGVDEVPSLLISSPVLHSGTLIRRDSYLAVGGYDRRCRYSVDTNMWLSLCAVGDVAYVDKPLYAYRAHDANLSNTAGALWTATEEMLVGVDVALDRFDDTVLPCRSKLRRTAVQRALVAVPTLDIFAGRLRRGWCGFYLAFRHYPMLTLFQARTIALVVRSILGAKYYDCLMRACRHVHGRGGLDGNARYA